MMLLSPKATTPPVSFGIVYTQGWPCFQQRGPMFGDNIISLSPNFRFAMHRKGNEAAQGLCGPGRTLQFPVQHAANCVRGFAARLDTLCVKQKKPYLTL